MLSSQCVKRTTGNCNKKKEFTFLTDRKGKTFPVWSDCSVCMNIIYNTAPLDLSDQEQEIRALAPAGIRLSFTTETAGSRENRRNLRPALPFRGSCFYEASGVYPGAF